MSDQIPQIPKPSEMTDEYLVDLALQKYACSCDPRCSRELHEWAMALRTELKKRLADRAEQARTAAVGWKRAIAELCGWSHISFDDDDSHSFWRNTDRDLGTYDSLDDIPLTPDDVFGCLNAWNECRAQLASERAAREKAEASLSIRRFSLFPRDEA